MNVGDLALRQVAGKRGSQYPKRLSITPSIQIFSSRSPVTFLTATWYCAIASKQGSN